MPDTTSLEMPGSEGGDSKGHMLMWIGAIAGVVGLVLLLKNQSSGTTGTTAAGTSINAALGSIQEENMNLLGTTQAGFMQTGQQIAGLSQQDMSNYTQLSNQVSSSFSDLNSTEAQNWAANNAALSGGFTSLGTDMTNLSGQVTGVSGQLSGLSSQVQGYDQTNQASFQHINDLINGLSTMQAQGQTNSTAYYQNLGALMNELSGQVSGVSGQLDTTQLGVSNIGQFLGWQFYQLPNRYSAYLPGGTSMGTSLNVSGIGPISSL